MAIYESGEMYLLTIYLLYEKGMEKVILGCFKENLASEATIKKNGGTLITENENYKEGKISQYYLIRL